MRVPCLKCPERIAGCHGTCEKYLKYKAEREQAMAARSAEHMAADVAVRSAIRRKKARNERI